MTQYFLVALFVALSKVESRSMVAISALDSISRSPSSRHWLDHSAGFSFGKTKCLFPPRCINRYKSSYDTSSRLLLNSLGWDNLSSRRAKQIGNLMYKCIDNLAPAYLCNWLVPRIPNHDFRHAKKSYYFQNQELIT